MKVYEIKTMHVIGSKALGGAEQFYIRLISSLHENKQPVAACYPKGSMIEHELNNTLPRYPARMRNVFDPFSKWSVGHAISRFSPNIVQTYMGRATRLVNLKNDKQKIHVARLGGFYNLKGFRHADAWVGISQGICDHMVANGIPAEKIYKISNFVDIAKTIDNERLNAFKKENNIPLDAYIVSSVGRLHPVKGYDCLLKAFAKLPNKIHNRPIFLVMAGDGGLRNTLMELAETSGISGRVRWLGWVLEPNIIYQSSDVFVCSSVQEGLGNVILEAWANKTPVISTKAEGPSELIEDEKTGLLVDINDIEEMSGAIKDLISENTDNRKKLIENGMERIKSKFSQKAVIDRYNEMYIELVN